MSEELCGKVDSMFLENLEEWILEEDKVVTYKYLSKSLKCHVNVAKQMLFNFVQEQQEKGNKDLGIVYLVSGFVKSDSGPTKLKVVMIEEKDMDKQSPTFEKVLTKHIYSVQKHKKISSTALFATDIMSVREDIYSCNAQNAIKNKAAVPRPSEAFNQMPGPSKDVKPVIKKEPTAAASSAIATKPKLENKKPSPKKVSPSKIKKEDVSKKTGSAGKKAGSNIANMFAKQAAKPKEVKPPKEDLTSKTSPGKENLENARIEEEKKSESAEKKKESASKVTTSKASSKASSKSKKNSSSKDSTKKRKRIQVQSDSDESDEEGVVERPPSEDEAPPQARIIESDDEEIPSTPQPKTKSSQAGRRKVRKEVDKTYMDAKGFMVTKKEFVYESEDEPAEEEPETKPKSAAKKTSPTSADKVAPAAKKAKLAAAGGAKQPGIMSFFKKK